MSILLQFGAGNIGRSLCANIFSSLGWETVFVDTDQNLVDELNLRGSFNITVKEEKESVIKIKPVRALSFKQHDEILEMFATADVISTAVGARNLYHLFPVFAEGLNRREDKVNILICENIKNSEEMFYDGLAESGFTGFDRVGLVGTAIEKMVPTVPAEVRSQDILATWGELYNLLQVDSKGLCKPLPDSQDILPVKSLAACYERKLFISNLCHTLTSVMGYLNDFVFIAEALSVKEIRAFVKAAAGESAEVLSGKYPALFLEQSSDSYIEQFLRRLGNLSLKDTVYRGGRDIGRKLQLGERLVGPAVLYYDFFGKVPAALGRAVAAAMYFKAPDENGNSFDKDITLCEIVQKTGAASFLREEIGIKKREALLEYIESEYNKGWDSF